MKYLKESEVLLFDPGTREVFDTGSTFSEFHNMEIPIDHEVCLMSKYFQEWKAANNRDIAHNECVGYKVPLLLNGREGIENMEVFEMKAYWESSEYEQRDKRKFI